MSVKGEDDFKYNFNVFCQNILTVMKTVWGKEAETEILQLWRRVFKDVDANLEVSIASANKHYEKIDFLGYFSDEIKIYNKFFDGVKDRRDNILNLRLFKLAKVILNSLIKFFQGTSVGMCLDMLKELTELTKWFHMKSL